MKNGVTYVAFQKPAADLLRKGVGKYDKSVEILKMLAAPPMGGKI